MNVNSRGHNLDTRFSWLNNPFEAKCSSSPIWLPICNRLRTRPGRAEPEIFFRIVHQVGQNSPLLAPYREQTVEIALGSNGGFECGNVSLKLWAPPSQVVSPVPPRKPAKQPKTPRVVELLRKAIEWRRQIDVGEVHTQAEIAHREGITRARVTQVIGLLRLAPEVLTHILSIP